MGKAQKTVEERVLQALNITNRIHLPFHLFHVRSWTNFFQLFHSEEPFRELTST